MRIFHVLDKIENAIYNSRKVPFSNYVLVRQDKILNLIEKTRQNLPEEMKQARWVSQENQRIIQDSQTKAGEILRESEKRANELLKAAKEESRKLLDKELIVVNAKNRADELLSTAQKDSDTVLNEAKTKAAETLKSAELKATDLTRKTTREAEITRKGANEYALKVLTGMENEFTRILAIIKKSKEALLESEQETPPAKPESPR